MAFIGEVQEAAPHANARGDFLEEENEVGNVQIPQPARLIPAPVQENSIGAEDPVTPAPPPPPEEQESDVGFACNDCPAKFRCAFPQRIDADGPPPEIIWNPGGWELPQGTLQSEQGGQVAIKLPDSFPPPRRLFLRIVSCRESDFHKSSVPGPQYQFSLVGRVSYRPKANSQYAAHLIFRTTAWSGGLVKRVFTR